MSGSKQHFVPQFLQRGFLSAGKRSVIVYNKDGRCFPSNISDVGASKYFYSTERDDADVLITSLESDLAMLINDLRADCALIHDTHRINNLISHLSIRSNNLRLQYLDGTNFILDGLKEKFASSYVIKNYFMKNQDIIRSLICEKTNVVPDAVNTDVDTLFEFMTRNYDVFNNPILKEFSARLLQIYSETLPQTLKAGHIKAINNSLDITNGFIKDFCYQVIVSKGVILGDSMVIYQVESERSFKTVVDENDVVNAVILPIASDKVLVGSKKGYRFDINMLRSAVAECSYDFFIASNKNSENLDLVTKISKNSYLLLEKDYQKIVDNYFV